MARKTPLQKLAEAAMMKSANEDIQFLHRDDIEHMVRVSLTPGLDWPKDKPGESRYKEFAAARGQAIAAGEMTCEEGACATPQDAYSRAMGDLHHYFKSLRPSDRRYSDLQEAYSGLSAYAALQRLVRHASARDADIQYIAPNNLESFVLHRFETRPRKFRDMNSADFVLGHMFAHRMGEGARRLDTDTFIFNKYDAMPNDQQALTEFRQDGGAQRVMDAASSFKEFLESVKPGTEAYNDLLDAYISLHKRGKARVSREESSKVIPFRKDSVQLEIGAGNNTLSLIDSFRKYDGKKHLVIVDDDEDIASLAERYAKRLGLTTLSVMNTDVASASFPEELRSVLRERHGREEVDIVHAGGMLRYVPRKKQPLFFSNCHKVMKPGARMLIEEYESEVDNRQAESCRKRGEDVYRNKDFGLQLRRFYNLEPLAEETGFAVKKHELSLIAKGKHFEVKGKRVFSGAEFLRKSELHKKPV